MKHLIHFLCILAAGFLGACSNPDSTASGAQDFPNSVEAAAQILAETRVKFHDYQSEIHIESEFLDSNYSQTETPDSTVSISQSLPTSDTAAFYPDSAWWEKSSSPSITLYISMTKSNGYMLADTMQFSALSDLGELPNEPDSLMIRENLLAETHHHYWLESNFTLIHNFYANNHPVTPGTSVSSTISPVPGNYYTHNTIHFFGSAGEDGDIYTLGDNRTDSMSIQTTNFKFGDDTLSFEKIYARDNNNAIWSWLGEKDTVWIYHYALSSPQDPEMLLEQAWMSVETDPFLLENSFPLWYKSLREYQDGTIRTSVLQGDRNFAGFTEKTPPIQGVSQDSLKHLQRNSRCILAVKYQNPLTDTLSHLDLLFYGAIGEYPLADTVGTYWDSLEAKALYQDSFIDAASVSFVRSFPDSAKPEHIYGTFEIVMKLNDGSQAELTGVMEESIATGQYTDDSGMNQSVTILFSEDNFIIQENSTR